MVFAHDDRGRCVFLETGQRARCAIHHQLGQSALASACRHFPRLARLTPSGVDLSLSHYCPTVADLPFARPLGRWDAGAAEEDPLLRIVPSPPAFPAGWPYEGLDAREVLPPLLRPRVLMSWTGHERWEEHVVAVVRQSQDPDQATERLARDAERIRSWTPQAGDFDLHLERELARAEPVAPPTAIHPTRLVEAAFTAWDQVAATIPRGRQRPASPRAKSDSDHARSHALAGWASFTTPLRRWLAAKAFASWLPLQGEGIRTSVVGFRAALGVLRAESLRACAERGRPLDGELLKQAFRAADLLLVHLADPVALAQAWSRCEHHPISGVARESPRWR